ncbi:MAG: response regulator [Vicinamibacteria bacterium]|nr:response regulator [Vicinamibacteria bacterium]
MNPRRASVDPEQLDQLRALGVENGVDLVNASVHLFRSDASARVNQLLSALECGDSHGAGFAAHSLQGSAAQMGAVRLARLSRYLERRVRGNETHRLSRFRPTLENELGRVFSQLPGGAAAGLAAQVSERSTRVLVADDEPHISYFLSSVLRAGGYATEEASSEKEILTAVRSFRPDLIILDWFLADTTAPAILDRLAALNEHPPVIILSSRSYEAQSLRDFERFGLVACLPKPIGPRALLHSLRDAGFGAHTC